MGFESHQMPVKLSFKECSSPILKQLNRTFKYQIPELLINISDLTKLSTIEDFLLQIHNPINAEPAFKAIFKPQLAEENERLR